MAGVFRERAECRTVCRATARLNDAVVWTQDADFQGLDAVMYFEKK